MSAKKSPYITMNTSMNSSFYTNVSNCIICLDEVRCRGKLSVCKHWFCFGCILEWSKNTNTCPVCKTRFRSISKVHLSPLKSPPTKVRVPDKDQRVWNDADDDGVTEELLYDILNNLREDMDDDYEPPTHWSITDNLQSMQYDFDLDAYDLEDSFIDDSNLTQQTQPSSHTPERFFLTQQLTEEEEYALVTRDSPYMLRRRSGRSGPGTRGSDVMADIYALNHIDEDTVFEDISSDESSGDSLSTDSSLSDVDEEEDESNKRTKSTRSSRTIRSQGPRRSTRSQTSRNSTRPQAPTRNTRSQAPTGNTRPQAPTRNTRSQAPSGNTRSQAPTGNTRSQAPRRSTRSGARHQKEQTRNQRQREDQMIAQHIQDTGSSGWLNTRSANERAAAKSAARAIAQTTNHNSSSSQTWGGTAGPSHEHDDDTYDSDKSGKSPMRTSAVRATEDKRNCRKKSGFSKIRVRLSSESELSEIDVLISPTKPNVLQKSPGSNNRKSPVPRNMDISLPSTSRIIEDDDTMGNQSEVKKWKRISNGKKGKGKENKPLSRSLFSQSSLVGSTDDPDFIQGLSDELPSKRRRLGLINNRNVFECQESSSAALRVTRARVQRLENDSHPLDINAKGSVCSSQPSSLTTEDVNHGYLLRKRSQGYQENSDDDDWDNYDSDDDAENFGKRRRNGKSVRMPRDYKDTTDDNDDDDDDDKKSRDKEKSRKTNDDDDKHVDKGKRKETKVSRLRKCRYNTDDEDDDNQVSTGKNETTSSVTWLKGKPTSTNDDDDDDDCIMDDEPPNIVIPTPQPDKKRSLFTKRQHTIICEQFDDQINEQDLPRYGRYLRTQSQLPKSSSKSKPGGHENEKGGTKVMPCRGISINLVKNEVSNEDFTPDTSVVNNHIRGSYTSNKSTVKRTRRRIKMYDSDSD